MTRPLQDCRGRFFIQIVGSCGRKKYARKAKRNFRLLTLGGTMLKRIAATFFIITLLCTTCAYAKTVEFILDEPTYSAIDNYQKETSAPYPPGRTQFSAFSLRRK